MTAKISDAKIQARPDSEERLAFSRPELEWYGDAYEQLYMQKLQMDVQLRALAEKLKPKTIVLQ